MKTMRWSGWMVAAAIGLTVAPVVLEAQVRPPGRGGRGGAARIGAQGARGGAGLQSRRSVLENEVWQAHLDQVSRELRMTPNFRQRFQAVTQEYRRQRNDLLGRERTLKQQSRAAIQAGGGGEPPLAIVRRHIALAHEEATLFEQETETLLEFMEPADVLRIFQRREAMTERIRQLQAGGESDVLDLTARPVGGGRR